MMQVHINEQGQASANHYHKQMGCILGASVYIRKKVAGKQFDAMWTKICIHA